MKRVFGKIDRAIYAIVDFLSSLTVVAMVVIIMIMVLCRYVFRISLGGISEIPTFLLYLNVWFAAVLCAKEDGGHIALDFIGVFVKNKRFKKISKIPLLIVGVFSLGFFTYCCIGEVTNMFSRGITSPGVRMPLWYLFGSVLFCVVMMVVYYLCHLYKTLREVVKK